MGLNLTSAGDYAIRAMIHIACLPEGSVVLRSQIADAQGIPSSFTAKILRRLVRGRLLGSSRGVNGGFSLARPPAEISMLDIVEAIEGPLSLTDCSGGTGGCPLACDCPASLVWPKIQDSLRTALGSFTLEDLASAPRRNGRVADLAECGATPTYAAVNSA
jgi:Rrf2 family protein